MSQDQIDYKAVRRRVEEAVKQQKKVTRWIFFIVNLFMVTLFTIAGFGIANSQRILSNEDVVGALVMLATGSFMGVLFQFISLMLDTKAGEASIREKVVARELGQAMLNLGVDEDIETKRKRVMRLAEDGELEEIVEEPPSEAQNRRHSER
jgi:hypothetical protein